MEKKMQDYLHLYGIGVEVKFDNKIWKVSQFKKDTIRLTLKSDSSRWVEVYYSDVSAILTKLEDISEEDVNICGNMGYDFSDDPNPDMHPRKEDFANPTLLLPEQFHYLLSKGYDLFGLIESGLAIDKKTLQS